MWWVVVLAVVSGVLPILIVYDFIKVVVLKEEGLIEEEEE